MQVIRAHLLLVLAILVLAFGVLFAGAPARADDRVAGIPNFQSENPVYGLQGYVLGSACLSLPSSGLDLQCNPAFMANETKRQFRINTSFNDHVSKVNFYRERLASNDSIGITDSVLNQHDPLVARATTALWYQQDFWAVGFVPIRGGFGSLARNAAYPEISANIYKEMEVFAKAGFVASEDRHLQAGLQIRYVDRDFFRKKFELLDVLSDPGQLRIENQKVLYAEPGLSYAFDTSWASAVTASLTNLAVYQSGYYSGFDPIFDVGFSTAPPFLNGHFRTSTHYTDRPDLDLFSRFLWGAIYDYDDILSVTLGLGKTTAAIGVNGHIDSVVLGLGYKTEDISPDQWQSQRVSTVLFELGLVF